MSADEQVFDQPLDIALTPVEGSSRIAAMGYDEDSKTLAIQFQGRGVTCHYSNVPVETFRTMQGAESKGKYFGAIIKDKFDFKTLPMPDKA